MEAWDRAKRQRQLLGLAFAGGALAEWAWLNDRPDVVETVLEEWRHHAARPIAAPAWAEILRYAARSGVPVQASPRCPGTVGRRPAR